MAQVLRLIPISEESASTRTVLTEPERGTVFFSGNDVRDPYWHCGQCDQLLAKHVPRARLGEVVIKCGRCGPLNDTRLGK